MTGLPDWFSGNESTGQCRRPRFDPWFGKITWKWQPTLVFLPGEPLGQRNLEATVHGVARGSVMTLMIKQQQQQTQGWAPKKNWCFQIVVLEKILESPLDCKEIWLVNPKEKQPWMFIGRTDAEAETPILWPPDAMSQLLRKDPDAWQDWGQEEKGTTEDETIGWHHWLNGHESEQIQGDSEGCAKIQTQLSNWTATTKHMTGLPW